MKDKVLRPLFPSEIEDFASRRGVNKIAVKDFLSSIEFCETPDAATVNLRLYLKTHKLSKLTVKTIEEGIDRAIKRPIKFQDEKVVSCELKWVGAITIKRKLMVDKAYTAQNILPISSVIRVNGIQKKRRPLKNDTRKYTFHE